MGTVHPNLRGRADLKFITLDDLVPCDLLFVALPHGESMLNLERLTDLAPRLIDLGGDFRLADPETWRHYHGDDHPQAAALSEFVYGLPELYLDQIMGARLIANPGCYPTSAILGLSPALANGFVETDGSRKGLKFKPREADFVIYQIGLRLGWQFDLGPVNFDFNYTLGLNSFTKTDYRTSTHVTQFNLGWLF